MKEDKINYLINSLKNSLHLDSDDFDEIINNIKYSIENNSKIIHEKNVEIENLKKSLNIYKTSKDTDYSTEYSNTLNKS